MYCDLEEMAMSIENRNFVNELIKKRKQKIKMARKGEKPFEKQQPLTSSQNGIWYYDQIHRNAKFTICSVVEMQGPVKQEIMKEAIRYVIDAHSIFRLKFAVDENGIPYQYMNERCNSSEMVTVVEKCNKEDIRDYVAGQDNIIMDLQKDHLVHFTLIKEAEEKYRLVLRIHHIIADEMSLELLFRDVFDNYERRVTGKDYRLDRDDSFLKYCKETYAEGINATYWLDKLQQAEFISFGQNGFDEDGAEEKYKFAFPPMIQDKLNNFCLQHQTTEFSVFISAFIATVFLMDGNECISMMTPFSNRKTGDYMDAYGMFVHNSLLTFEMDYFMDFTTVMKKAAEEIMGTYENSQKSFDDIIRILDVSIELLKLQKHVVFTYLENPAKGRKIGELEISEAQVSKSGEKNNLSVIVERNEDSWNGTIMYSANWLKADFIETLAEKYIWVMEKCLNSPKTSLIDLIEIESEDEI